MAKKKATTIPKEKVTEEKVVNTETVVDEKVESKKDEFPIIIKGGIDKLNIEELIAYERACSIVCGKYEVKARLSGEDNAKFMDFLKYHKLFLNEMEKRVLNICKITE